MQRRGVRIAAGIARDDVQLRNRHVELGFVGVVEFEEFHVAFAEIHVDQALIAGDAVLLVDYRIANLELGQVAQPVVERGLALCGVARTTRRAAGVEFGFGDEGELIENEAFMQRRDAQRELAVSGQEPGKVGAGVGFQSVFGKQAG